jgi:hypothetical protein
LLKENKQVKGGYLKLLLGGLLCQMAGSPSNNFALAFCKHVAILNAPAKKPIYNQQFVNVYFSYLNTKNIQYLSFIYVLLVVLQLHRFV